MSITERVSIAWVCAVSFQLVHLLTPVSQLRPTEDPSHSPEYFPATPSDRASTLVLTAHSKRFTDLRVIQEPDSPAGSLDWGFTGHSVGTPGHGVWTHDVDSRTAHPEDERPDEGQTSPHPDMEGVSVERGEMWYPVTGAINAYEELWKDVEVMEVSGEGGGKRVSVVLEVGLDGVGEAKGAVVRVGQFCQGILRVGEEITAERWSWEDGAGEWTRTAGVGGGRLPCDATWTKLESVREGDTVECEGLVWTVKEVKFW